MLLYEWHNPPTIFRRKSATTGMFYIIIGHQFDEHIIQGQSTMVKSESFIKIGSTSRGKGRFSDRNFPCIERILCAFEFDTVEEARDMEDLTRVLLRGNNHLQYLPLDRFLVKSPLQTLDISYQFGEKILLDIKSTDFKFHCFTK